MAARRISRIPELVGSRTLSFVLLGLLAAYYVLLLIFSMAVHTEGVIGISRTLPFKVLYMALFANLLACTMRRTPGWLRRCRGVAELPEDAEPVRVITFASGSADGGFVAVEKALSGRRFGTESADGVVRGVKGRFSALASLVSHWGMVIILLGVVLSLNSRFVGEAMVTEGEKFNGTSPEYSSFDPPLSFRKWAPEVSFRLDRVEADFWADKLLFTRLAATIRYPADSKGDPRIIRINEPLFSNFYTTSVRLTGYGFTPNYVLRNEEGREMENSWVNLAIFPPGNEDSFRVGLIPHRFYVKLYPDYRTKAGRPDTASMNMNNPVFLLKVASHKVVTFNKLLLPYQRADVEGYSIAFEGMKKWVTVRVVKDNGYPALFVGALLVCIGSLWRFLFPRRDVWVRSGDDGRSILVFCRADSMIVSNQWAEDTASALEQAIEKGGADAA